MALHFGLIGFIASVSKALAEEKIPIFVISAYSADYLLINEDYIEKAVEKLKLIGFEVKER